MAVDLDRRTDDVLVAKPPPKHRRRRAALLTSVAGLALVAGLAIRAIGPASEAPTVLYGAGRFLLTLGMGLFASYVLLVVGSILLSVAMHRLRTTAQLLGRSRASRRRAGTRHAKRPAGVER